MVRLKGIAACALCLHAAASLGSSAQFAKNGHTGPFSSRKLPSRVRFQMVKIKKLPLNKTVCAKK
jgi:hypothetical protein